MPFLHRDARDSEESLQLGKHPGGQQLISQTSIGPLGV